MDFFDVPANSVIPVFFNTYNSTGGSVTITGLAVTDIEIYKGTSMTQRSSDAGYVLLDTDGIDLDGTTGIHGFSIDLSDNTDSGFYAVGSFYNVVVASITCDGQTVNFVAKSFRIIAAEANAGIPDVRLADAVSHGGTLGSGTATLALSRLSIVSQSSNTSAVTWTGNGTGHALIAASGSGATGNGFQLQSNATNGNGLALAGAGTGDGLSVVGGLTGHGFDLAGGGTSGNAIRCTTTDGHAVSLDATGSAKYGLFADTWTVAGQANFGGIFSEPSSGVALQLTSADDFAMQVAGTSGGANFVALAGNTNGITTTGSGTGSGILATSSGGNGRGLYLQGSGDETGLLVVGGATGNGVLFSAGVGGTTDFTAINTVMNITGGITGNITGNLSGSVGSVTGAVGSVTGAVGSVTGNVGGNVTGSVGSVVGNVGGNVNGTVASVVGAVGSVTGNVGGNVAGSVGSVTGNVGGNVAGSVGSVTGNVGGNVTGSVGSIASGGITEASFATTAGSFYPLAVVDQGTAQAATSSTIRLRAAAGFADDELIGARVLITGGTLGVGQSAEITDYVSATDTATVTWPATTPTGTITYKVFSAISATGGTGLTAQQTRDAMQLSPTGVTQANSIDDKLDNLAAAAGTGAFTITVTVTDGTDPLQNARVRVIEGVNNFISDPTDVLGQAQFALDAATYDVAVAKDGYQFTPTTRTVTGNESGTLTNDLEMVQVAPNPPPAEPDQCVIYGYIRDMQTLEMLAGVNVTATLSATSAYKTGGVIAGRSLSTQTNSAGYFQISVPTNASITPSGTQYLIECDDCNFQVTATCDTATLDIGTLIT